MVIPLSIFLVVWLVLLAIFSLVALVSVIQMLRFGVAGPGTYVSTGFFLIVVALVVGSTLLYLTGVDWSLGLTLGDVTAS
jgi:hypothetical protein